MVVRWRTVCFYLANRSIFEGEKIFPILWGAGLRVAFCLLPSSWEFTAHPPDRLAPLSLLSSHFCISLPYFDSYDWYWTKFKAQPIDRLVPFSLIISFSLLLFFLFPSFIIFIFYQNLLLGHWNDNQLSLSPFLCTPNTGRGEIVDGHDW